MVVKEEWDDGFKISVSDVAEVFDQQTQPSLMAKMLA